MKTVGQSKEATKAYRKRELGVAHMVRTKIYYQGEMDCIKQRASRCPEAQLPQLMQNWNELRHAVEMIDACIASGKIIHWSQLP